MLKDDWLIFENIDRLSEQLANDILALAQKSIKLNVNFKHFLIDQPSIIWLRRNIHFISYCNQNNFQKPFVSSIK